MAGRARRGHDAGRAGESIAVRAARDRERHLAQVTSFGFFSPRRPRRTVTVTPSPLRYWQYDAARWAVVVLVLLAVGGWLASSAGATARPRSPTSCRWPRAWACWCWSSPPAG